MLRFTCNDSTHTLSLQIIKLLLRLWDLSLQGFEKAVAISVCQPPHPTHTVITRLCRSSDNLIILGLSLREPKVRGNLSMGYNYSFMEFFFFSAFVFVVSGCGLLRRFTPRNDEKVLSLRKPKACGNLGIRYYCGKQNSSLREPKVRGNLGMEHYDSQTKFCGNP